MAPKTCNQLKLKAAESDHAAHLKRMKAPVVSLSEAAAIQALSVIYVLDATVESLMFRQNSRIVKGSKQFVLERPKTEKTLLIPLHQYLSRRTVTHHARIQLILSLTSAVARWAANGVVMQDFRADQPDYRDFYFVQESKDRSPQFVLGDIGILGLTESLNLSQFVAHKI